MQKLNHITSHVFTSLFRPVFLVPEVGDSTLRVAVEDEVVVRVCIVWYGAEDDENLGLFDVDVRLGSGCVDAVEDEINVTVDSKNDEAEDW